MIKCKICGLICKGEYCPKHDKKQKKIFNPSEEIINDIKKGQNSEFTDDEIILIDDLSKGGLK